MTAIATILALIPLAAGFNQGSIIAAELGTVVIGGLFSSTFLTLLVIPVVYSLVDGVKVRLSRKPSDAAPTEPGSSRRHRGRGCPGLIVSATVRAVSRRPWHPMGPGPPGPRVHPPAQLPKEDPMAITRFAEATWNGDLLNGSGTINYVSSGALSRMPVTWASRTEEHNGRTSPEELIASAHAACFSMAFSSRLAKNGTPATRLDVRAVITFDKGDAGWKIARSDITVRGEVPGIDAATFTSARRRRQGQLPGLGCAQGQRRALGGRRPRLGPGIASAGR